MQVRGVSEDRNRSALLWRAKESFSGKGHTMVETWLLVGFELLLQENP